MSLLLLLLLVAIAAGVAAGVFLHTDSGYVLVSLGPWVLESSVLAFIGAMIVLVAIFVYGTRLVVAGLRLPSLVRDALNARRERRARESFESGLHHLLEGDWKRAEVELVRRASDHPLGGLNYLFAARAAQRVGSPARRENYLELAASRGGRMELAAHLARAELQIQRGDHAAAKGSLEPLYATHPGHPYVIELLASSYRRNGDWQALRQLLGTPQARAALPEARVRRLLTRSLCELMKQATGEARLDQLKAIWDTGPASQRGVAQVRLAYVQGLARMGVDGEAAAIVHQALKQEWDGELVAEYGRLGGVDAVTQLASVESWLGQYGEKPELLLAAGRACMRNQLWGKARSYLDAAVRIAPAPEAFLALSQLCADTRNPEEANRFAKRGLELAASGQ